MSDIKTYSDIEPKLQQFMEHNEELTPLFNDNSQNLPFVSIMEMGANPPVSYTHLDVYKRQLDPLPEARLSEGKGIGSRKSAV